MEQFELNFGASLKKVLEKKKISLSELSRGTQIPVSTLHSWITGIQPKSFEHLVKISSFLDVSCDELVMGSNQKSSLELPKTPEDFQQFSFEVSIKMPKDYENIFLAIERQLRDI